MTDTKSQSAEPGRQPEPSHGPDEEGEVPLDPPVNGKSRPGAWVRKGAGKSSEE